MRVETFAFAAVVIVLPINPASAACTKPDTPACATPAGPFATDKAADDCRKDMLRFRDGMEVYALCLGETSASDEKAARAAYEDIRVRFNRRARGE